MQTKTSTTSRLANMVGKKWVLWVRFESELRLVWMSGSMFYELIG